MNSSISPSASASLLERESKIAPQAIALDRKEIEQAGIDPNTLAIAQPASKALVVHFCTEQNRPHKETLASSIDKILGPAEPAKDQASETFNIDRVKPNYFNSQTTRMPSESGVNDPQGLQTYIAAFFTLMAILSAFAMILCSILLAIYPEQKLYLIGPVSALFFGLIYFIHSRRVTCCICHQKIFSRSRNGKKKGSHYHPLLGFIIPTCLHILLFARYRCMTCGSQVDCKKRKSYQKSHN